MDSGDTIEHDGPGDGVEGSAVDDGGDDFRYHSAAPAVGV